MKLLNEQRKVLVNDCFDHTYNWSEESEGYINNVNYFKSMSDEDLKEEFCIYTTWSEEELDEYLSSL